MSDPDQVSLSAILERLGRLEDERAIGQVVRLYCLAADHGSDEDWLDLFTDDAVLDTHGPREQISRFLLRDGEPTETGVRFTGKDALRRFIAGRYAADGWETKHHSTVPLVDLNGDEARSVCYFLVTNNDEGVLSVYASGRYIDRMVRCPDGAWRIARREIYSGPTEPPSEDAIVIPQKS